MTKKRFDVRLHPNALKEYNDLDNSVISIIDKAIDELEYRADQVGKNLSNLSSTKLAGCKEIKLRDAGVRIIFRVTNEVVEVLRVVYVYTVEKRNDDFVFKIADKRNKEFKNLKKDELIKHLEESEKWNADKTENNSKEKIAKICMWISVQNNSKFARGKKKVNEYINWYLNNFYKVEHDPKAYDYVIYMPYETTEGLEQEVDRILQEIANEADYRNCIIEFDARCDELNLQW